ncbi:MAG: glycosyl hydrolase [Ignavibacteriaceae bacterium]|nr:glycosyl hydrolase [Ignavibacteria bacterium]NNJ52901.1 glycosyl hydrolase [Ignavibacteriaceae bacterium]NNL19934.1 glycosyl hydrolase [Ignavibacteriaceae bacterium]
MKKFTITFILLLIFTIIASAQNNSDPDSLKNISLSGLSFRSIGPAITGGRTIDIAVNPFNHSEYFVASGHGSLWKTTNRGITFSPVFDGNKSYAIGSVEIDPTNPNVVWVGTGENKNQNNVIYGDGIYKSEDGGKSWKNMGISASDHIGGIAIDYNNSNIVYIAAYGSSRKSGGDRGIFKTTDGGKTWEQVLEISEYTGCYEVHMDPRYSNILYATAHQRMRNLYTGVYGGPESGIYRTLDGGENWEKLKSGLPSEDVGRIGMAISPVNPDYLYAIVEATTDDKGIYRSTDRGASWTKQNSYISSYAFYFQKLYCDTKDVNRVYSDDVFIQVTKDGGKTWSNLGDNLKHVDNHALWIDPNDNNHLIAGCDGGVYETYDMAKHWDFKANIPITEIYKVTTDNDEPFYNVYIGTQDNNSLGGPSRTISSAGILNQDWLFTNSGDGFETQVDWTDPNIIYSQSQFGGLVRFDKRSGENLFIQPQDFADTAYRFDWDAGFLLSKHDNKRLYFGGNKLLKSDDMGSTWIEISPDLTRGVPKEMQRLMGQSWSIDQLARKGSMAQIVTIAESPLDKNVLLVGSGDGLIHFTTDGGTNWSRGSTPGLPEYARIHHLIASNFDKLVAYAVCHNFVGGDYRPYLYKTTNGGTTWFSINSNLPEKGSTYSIQEDHVDKNLLFIGTQFGVYFTNNGGDEWLPLKSGMPAHSVMDLEIQQRENDLVVSTFGRGVYILDDYTPLRYLNEETLKKEAEIFPIKDALMFIESHPFGFKGTAFQGASFYSAPNPEVGAVFTYYLKEGFKTLKEIRREEEKEKQKSGDDIKYPSYDRLESEMNEQDAYLLFTVTDEQGNVIRKLKTEGKKGVNRIVWDFRYTSFTPISLEPFDDSVPWVEADKGYMVVPGKYFVSLSKFKDGTFTELVQAKEFNCLTLNNTTLPSEDKSALDAFNKKVAELTRAVTGADAYRKELVDKLAYLKKAIMDGANVEANVFENILAIELDIKELNKKLNGDNLRRRYEGAVPSSVKDRVNLITGALWSTTAAPTTTFIKSYDDAAGKFGEILNSLKLIDDDIKQVEDELEKSGAPYTPGRFPEWRRNN